jgi:hypothetical protein
MVIVTHTDFRPAAERLRQFRSSRLPFYNAPNVKVVTTEEVYDNFSAGLPDPMAVRNYIKFLYDNSIDANGNPSVGYVLLFGDATTDFRNNVSSTPDFVPTNLYLTRITPYPMATDQWFGHLDENDQISGRAVMDVAVGRIPAESLQEGNLVVDKIITYETGAPLDPWRNRIILVADDEKSSFESSCEVQWTFESEQITYTEAPDFLDVQKIYLMEYPPVGSAEVKPQSRLAFLEKWNAGALLINYIGHGSSVQMADEQVFLASDVSLLENGSRLPMLMAFSCTIGDFANPAGKSLSERLVLRKEGGVIATITAATESYPSPNSKVAFGLFQNLLPRVPGEPYPPVGLALLKSKLISTVETNQQPFQEENNFKYNIMGDPALRLASGRQPARFESPLSGDTLVAGARRSLRGHVVKNGAIDTAFNGIAQIEVREPVVRRDYVLRCAGNATINYRIPGGVIYQGTADVTNGEFAINFRVPRLAATGPRAFAMVYANSASSDAVTSMDSVLVIVSPGPEDSLSLQPQDGAPRVTLGFKSGLETVKPGDTVRAVVRDQDGINILATTNEGRQAILIDNLPVPIDVNEYFEFDHGGVDTSGVLLFPLPDMSAGKHRLVYKVSDSFGATTLDTLFFDVADPLDFFAKAVLNYPNPFQTSTQFLFQLSNRARITLDIYTVSGRRVRKLEQFRDGGDAWIEWDGRDAAGDTIANGTYLYVATVDFVGLDRPPTVLRGKLTKIQ